MTEIDVAEAPGSLVASTGQRPKQSWFLRTGAAMQRQAGPLLALVTLGLIVLGALLAPYVAPFDPNAQDLNLRLRPPTWQSGGEKGHLLGNDHVGRDVLSRIVYGGRVSLAIGAAAVLCGGVLGTALGFVSGYRGGLLDEVIMRTVDVQLSIPFILLAIVFMAVFGVSLRNLVMVLIIYGWVTYARLVRGQVLSLRDKDYVTALRVLGGSHLRAMLRHILPNLLSSLVVVATLETANVIILESGLSFLGLGADPRTPSWGSMLSDGRDYLTSAWWLATFPGLAITITVVCINVLGDWLRDRLDPRLRT
jgi:peptide/nickel transport system permease protein